MNIIFLDIDGVLNSEFFYKKRNISDSDPYPYSEISSTAVKYLNEIIKKSDNTKVVISSVWRLGRSIEELQNILNKKGFIGEVLDITPSFHSPFFSVPRGCEINDWLEKKGNLRLAPWNKEHQMDLLSKSKINNYIILDDDTDFLLNQKNHFIKCNGYGNGLGLKESKAAIKILNTSFIELHTKFDT